jgi:hypothetical protein
VAQEPNSIVWKLVISQSIQVLMQVSNPMQIILVVLLSGWMDRSRVQGSGGSQQEEARTR